METATPQITSFHLACENIRFSSLFAAERGETDVFAGYVSLNTADFKTQTSHTVRFKNTATPQAEILFTGTPHEKMPNTATPQHRKFPMSPSS